MPLELDLSGRRRLPSGVAGSDRLQLSGIGEAEIAAETANDHVIEDADAKQLAYMDESAVMASSSGLGSASPLGWLCTSTVLAAEVSTRNFIASRGWTSEAARLPTLTWMRRNNAVALIQSYQPEFFPVALGKRAEGASAHCTRPHVVRRKRWCCTVADELDPPARRPMGQRHDCSPFKARTREALKHLPRRSVDDERLLPVAGRIGLCHPNPLAVSAAARWASTVSKTAPPAVSAAVMTARFTM